MNNLTINIGLMVGTIEPTNQLELTRDFISSLFKNVNYIISNSNWLNEEGIVIEERVAVFSINVGDLKPEAINLLLISTAILLYQDAIAYKLNGEGYLVYNPAFEGELQDFNQEFFKEF